MEKVYSATWRAEGSKPGIYLEGDLDFPDGTEISILTRENLNSILVHSLQQKVMTYPMTIEVTSEFPSILELKMEDREKPFYLERAFFVTKENRMAYIRYASIENIIESEFGEIPGDDDAI